MYQMFIKRILDTIISGIALIVLSPVILVTAVLVKIKLGSPIVFKQKRPGKDEKIFEVYKFRSMTNARDENGELLPDSMRLTSFGRALRRSSLDELLELYNIFKGDMALVGPRPLAVQYLPYYSDEERKRHSVLPGLTGLAQIHGRNATTWEERFEYDVRYVQHVTFCEDVRIVLETVKVVLVRSGIGERGVDSPIDFDKYRQAQFSEEEKYS